MGLKRTAAHPSAVALLCPPPRCLRLSHCRPNPFSCRSQSNHRRADSGWGTIRPPMWMSSPASAPPLEGAAVPLSRAASTVQHSTAIRYPSIENLFNGCQGHPLICPPPGTAQRQPDRMKKGSNAQHFIQLTVVGDIKCEKRLKPENRKDPLIMTCTS